MTIGWAQAAQFYRPLFCESNKTLSHQVGPLSWDKFDTTTPQSLQLPTTPSRSSLDPFLWPLSIHSLVAKWCFCFCSHKETRFQKATLLCGSNNLNYLYHIIKEYSLGTTLSPKKGSTTFSVYYLYLIHLQILVY